MAIVRDLAVHEQRAGLTRHGRTLTGTGNASFALNESGISSVAIVANTPDAPDPYAAMVNYRESC